MPRINYQLSFENYQEITANRQTAPSYTVALWIALLGLMLILAGYFYLRVPPPDNRALPGLILLGSGLLAEFLATLLALFMKPKRKAKFSETALRREFNQYAADARYIEYDETGFRIKWFDGEDFRPWSVVHGLHDMKTLLVISATSTHYWLPKAALESENHLEQIKALASVSLNQGLLFRVPIKPNAFVYVLASMFDHWRRQLQTRILVYLAVTVALYWGLCADWGYGQHQSALDLFLVPIILPLCQALYFLRKYFSARWAESASEAEIMKDRVTYQTPETRVAFEYRLLHEWREIPGTFMLYFSATQFHFIPKYGFAPSQIKQFRMLLEKNFPPSGT